MIPLVLLPGMMCDYRLFTPQINALGRRHTIVLPPIAGHPTMTALAAAMLANAPPRFALAGLSMGGIVAMEVLAQAPDRVDRLALLDTNPLAETSAVQARRAPQIARVKAGGLFEVMRDEMKPNYLAGGPGQEAVLDLCLDMALSLGPETFVNQSLALRDRPDYQPTLRAFTRPALVLCGAEDRLCPVARHQLIHSLMPHSTLTIIPGAGHLPTLEQPQTTTAALSRWLED